MRSIVYQFSSERLGVEHRLVGSKKSSSDIGRASDYRIFCFQEVGEMMYVLVWGKQLLNFKDDPTGLGY